METEEQNEARSYSFDLHVVTQPLTARAARMLVAELIGHTYSQVVVRECYVDDERFGR